MPLIETKGAASAQGFGEFAASSGAVTYIEDVFSTYLYTGNGSSQTITNGIDLSTKGGMVWLKARSATSYNLVTDSARGAGAALRTESIAANQNIAGRSFYTNGFDVNGSSDNFGNGTNTTYASWTFRKQPKFFDVVTYTGNGSNRNIAHNLGSAPGCMIIKSTTLNDDWYVFHHSLGAGGGLTLNTTNAYGAAGNLWDSTYPSSTVFRLGTNSGVNQSGQSYVAYLFAHNAGGFGLTGTDNVISCGSYTGNGSTNGPTVTLGYEPQWILMKNTTESGDWYLVDVMRGWTVATSGNNITYLNANTSNAESLDAAFAVTSTGFKVTVSTAAYNNSGSTYIYIAIRRGPMKVPTSGTSVFLPTSRTGNASLTTVTSGFAPDVVLSRRVDNLDNGNESVFADKLRGTGTLSTNNTAAEYAGGATSGINAYTNTGIVLGINNNPIYAFNYATLPYATYQFQRAPSFFDEVCYTGTGSLRTVSHNLGAVPELLIVKRRDTVEDWNVYSATTGNAAYLRLNTTAAVGTAGADALWGSTTPTSSVFTVKTSGGTNASGGTFVAYLFATCAGVSKVGSYTGTGALQTVNCGFTGGARFVLIKRTDSTGDWYVYDSARGITSGNDPYLFLNSTAAEVTGTNYVDTDSTGFKVTAAAPAGLNASGGTYIFLAIA